MIEEQLKTMIEQNELIINMLEKIDINTSAAPAPVATPVAPAAPVAAPVAAPAPAAPVAAAAPAAPVAEQMTAEYLNAEAMKEFQRLGGDDNTDAFKKVSSVWAEHGADSISKLDPSLYNEVLVKLRALK